MICEYTRRVSNLYIANKMRLLHLIAGDAFLLFSLFFLAVLFFS